MTQSEQTLVYGAIMVALYGLERLYVNECRQYGMNPYDNPSADLKEIRRVLDAVRLGQTVETAHKHILQTMAHTCQTLRVVSYDDWDKICPVKEKKDGT